MNDRPLWTLDALVAAVNGRARGKPLQALAGISIDSRTLAKGEAFFAIRGDRVDGHDYVADAIKQGAGACIVSEARLADMPADAPLVVVPDVLEALRALARAARVRSKAKIIAVTGSVGKTSSKEMLRAALARDGETHASAASFNNHWGVPLSLARLPESARYGVFELGMNHAGELTPLSQLVRPHVALITTVEPVHVEYFPSIEAIADAKAEIFAGLETGGFAVLNRDNPYFDRLVRAANAAGATAVSFGRDAHAQARLIDCVLHGESSTVRADILGDEVVYKLGVPGRHVVQNSLGVLACVKLAGADLALAALSLAQLAPPKGRGQRISLKLPKGGEVLLLDESYNANPASMRAAIEVLGAAPIGARGRRIAVLGDMLELGAEAVPLHAALAPQLEAAKVDLVFCAGPLMRALYDALPAARRGGYAESAARIEPEVMAALRSGDAVMIKGSNASKMHSIAAALIQKFSARDTATA